MPKRGDIWTVDLVGVGHEQQGSRPVLIISENEMNDSGINLVVAIPITTALRGWATRVRIVSGEGGLTSNSEAMCEQILRLDIPLRLKERLGAVTPQTLLKVTQKLIVILGIE
jgi:mRNA interferase MazF